MCRRVLQERHAAHARPGAAAGGRGRQGRIRKPAEGPDRRGEVSPTPIILFIDEAHTMIGAGGQAGQNDAANLLKPALARGELRTIAATTWSEYKKYFEKDPALARRFQVVKVEEPTEEQCAVMMRGIVADAGEAPQRAHSRRRRRGRREALASLSCRTASFPTRPSAFWIPPARVWRWARTPFRRRSKTPRATLDDLRGADARSRARSGARRRSRASGWQRSPKQKAKTEQRAGRTAGALGEGTRPGEPDPRNPQQDRGGRRLAACRAAAAAAGDCAAAPQPPRSRPLPISTDCATRARATERGTGRNCRAKRR